MTNPGEQAERQAFVQASIDATQAVFSDPIVRPHLTERFGDVDLAYHEQLTARMFPAEVVDGVIRMPEDRQATGSIPVIAIAPGETPRISPDFAKFSPEMRRSAETQLDAWGAILSHGTYINAVEYLARLRLAWNMYSFPDAFTPDSRGLFVTAAVHSLLLTMPFQHDVLPNSKAVPKLATTRAIVGLRYMGPDTPPPKFGTMIHEEIHVKQQEANPLFERGSEEDDRKNSVREELEGYHAGALAISAQIDAGYTDVTDGERLQLDIEEARAFYNGYRADPFEPSPALMRQFGAAFVADKLDTKMRET